MCVIVWFTKTAVLLMVYGIALYNCSQQRNQNTQTLCDSYACLNLECQYWQHSLECSATASPRTGQAKQTNLITPEHDNRELRRSQLCPSGPILPRIGLVTWCSALTFVADQNLFDCRALTVWRRGAGIPPFSASCAEACIISTQHHAIVVLKRAYSQQPIKTDKNI